MTGSSWQGQTWHVSPRNSVPIHLNASLSWSRNVGLWRHGGARRQDNAELQEYFPGKLEQNSPCLVIQDPYYIIDLNY